MSPGEWALRGERSLRTGRPAHARVTAAEAGLTLYVAVALVLITVFLGRWLRGVPDIIRVMMVSVWGIGILQLLAMLASLLVIEPRRQRGTVYEVTNYRVIVAPGASRRGAGHPGHLRGPAAPTGGRDRPVRMGWAARGAGGAGRDHAGRWRRGPVGRRTGPDPLVVRQPGRLRVRIRSRLAGLRRRHVRLRRAALLPPIVRGSSLITGLASADGSPRRRGWQQLTWPASTVTPPAFIGLADAEEVAGLVGAAQLSARAPVKG